ncbi:MAG: DUF2235 domain-containing protein [Propionibacteriales bacterium]|nr:DUF2235 domain-containing protein [Propionibacteriales bacterium]
MTEGLPAESPSSGAAPKKLVVCLDGTRNQIGAGRSTNPAKVFQMLDLDTPSEQMAYYDPGVGTLPAATVRGKLAQWGSQVAQMAFGFGMKANMTQAYTWLMRNYRPDDKVYIFGFSRGAYTARALVGLLARPGLLRSGSDNLVEYAVKEYIKRRPASGADDEPPSDEVKQFADALCWGTSRHLLNPDSPYCPTEWDHVHSIPVEYLGIWDTVEASGVGGIGEVSWPITKTLWNVRRLRHAVSIDESRAPYREFLVKPRDGFEEVWFSGVHSDVGGTFPEAELSTIALKWVFDGVVADLNLRDRQAEKVYKQWCQVEESFALAPIHENALAWKILLSHRRRIPHDAPIHVTVRARRANDPGYLVDLEIADNSTR